MKIYFLTSGFPNGFTDEFITELQKHLTCNCNFVFIASDFLLHEKTRRHVERFLQLFEAKGVTFENVFIIDDGTSHYEEVSLIESADVIWLAGGSTLAQIYNIKKLELIDALQYREGVTIGMSAGAINMAKKVVLARDLDENLLEMAQYDGIGLVDINIEPHLNKSSSEHIEDVKIASEVSPIYGLNDETFIKVVNGCMEIFGEYRLFSV